MKLKDARLRCGTIQGQMARSSGEQKALKAMMAYLEYCIIFVLDSPHSTENVYRNDESSW